MVMMAVVQTPVVGRGEGGENERSILSRGCLDGQIESSRYLQYISIGSDLVAMSNRLRRSSCGNQLPLARRFKTSTEKGDCDESDDRQ